VKLAASRARGDVTKVRWIVILSALVGRRMKAAIVKPQLSLRNWPVVVQLYLQLSAASFGPAFALRQTKLGSFVDTLNHVNRTSQTGIVDRQSVASLHEVGRRFGRIVAPERNAFEKVSFGGRVEASRVVRTWLV
jgi:hypothetical protein